MEGGQRLADSTAFMVPSSRLVAWFVRLNMRMMPYLPWLRDLPAKLAHRAATRTPYRT